MKSEKLRRNIIIYILIMIIIFTLLFFVCITRQENNLVTLSRVVNTKALEVSKNENVSIIGEKDISEAREKLNLKEYEKLPKEMSGYKVIGKISIPKLDVEKNILETTTTDSLLVSVTKICGPEINKTGNFCIAGHNYWDAFGRISSLEKEDEIKLTDTYDRTVTYKVYEVKKVSPYDTSCLSDETSGERELTLVTCTLGAIKRVVVKAIEVYD